MELTLMSEAKNLSVDPAPQVIPITRGPTIHLKTLLDVRIEMAKVYRSMKSREIETHEGTKLCYVLSQIGRVIEAEQVADRVDAIQRVLDRRKA